MGCLDAYALMVRCIGASPSTFDKSLSLGSYFLANEKTASNSYVDCDLCRLCKGGGCEVGKDCGIVRDR